MFHVSEVSNHNFSILYSHVQGRVRVYHTLRWSQASSLQGQRVGALDYVCGQETDWQPSCWKSEEFGFHILVVKNRLKLNGVVTPSSTHSQSFSRMRMWHSFLKIAEGPFCEDWEVFFSSSKGEEWAWRLKNCEDWQAMLWRRLTSCIHSHSSHSEKRDHTFMEKGSYWLLISLHTFSFFIEVSFPEKMWQPLLQTNSLQILVSQSTTQKVENETKTHPNTK